MALIFLLSLFLSSSTLGNCIIILCIEEKKNTLSYKAFWVFSQEKANSD